jgi:hypothetical protein
MSVIEDLARRARAGSLTIAMDHDQPAEAYPPASAAMIAQTATELGFALPTLLRDIYMRVGNGGFGPAYGLIGVAGGAPVYLASCPWHIVDLYRAFRARQTRHRPWDERLLPICHWGCSYFCYLDCALPQAPVFIIDEDRHGHGPWGCDFQLLATSFEEWMQRWLNGDNLWAEVELNGRQIFRFEEQAHASQA